MLVFNATGGTLDYIGAAASTTDRTIVLNGTNQVIAADGRQFRGNADDHRHR